MGAEGLAPPEALTTAFTELPATDYGIHSHYFVGKTGLEPTTSWSQTRRSNQLNYFPIYKISKLVNDLISLCKSNLVVKPSTD